MVAQRQEAIDQRGRNKDIKTNRERDAYFIRNFRRDLSGCILLYIR